MSDKNKTFAHKNDWKIPTNPEELEFDFDGTLKHRIETFAKKQPKTNIADKVSIHSGYEKIFKRAKYLILNEFANRDDMDINSVLWWIEENDFDDY